MRTEATTKTPGMVDDRVGEIRVVTWYNHWDGYATVVDIGDFYFAYGSEDAVTALTKHIAMCESFFGP